MNTYVELPVENIALSIDKIVMFLTIAETNWILQITIKAKQIALIEGNFFISNHPSLFRKVKPLYYTLC